MSSPPPACTLAELAQRTGARLEGDGNVVVSRVGTLEHAGPGDIAFLANPRYRGQLAGTRASAVIVSPDDAPHASVPRLVSGNPYATFAMVAQILTPEPPASPGIDAMARVHESAVVAASASIGPFAVVEAGSRIGERVRIGAHCVIGAGSVVAADAILRPRVTLYPRTAIGARTLVHSGAVLGADGFGMAEADGRWIKIPQAGRVVVGADCEIGANTTIDRGAIDDTILADDVKLDNQIQIGHNCTIGTHTAIAGCVGIAGSSHIGANCRIGGAAMISGHLSITAGTTISGGTLVFADVDVPGTYSGSFPMLPYREWRRVAAQVRTLARLRHRVVALEQALQQAAVGSDGPTDEEGSP